MISFWEGEIEFLVLLSVMHSSLDMLSFTLVDTMGAFFHMY